MSLHRSLAVLAGALVLAPSAHAAITPGGISFDPGTDRETGLLSRALDGGFPNGPSRNAAISQDRQLATTAAFESEASNIVANDGNGSTTDVFVVTRAEPFDDTGPPWRADHTDLVSLGLGGQPANGPSYLPDLDGDQLHPSHCVAFVSAASNLVPGDTNGKPDAFVRDLRTGRTIRVSVNSKGQQANGATYEVKLDGACDRVAFVSDATNLALTRSRRKATKPLVTTAPPAGTKQVYVRILGGQADDKGTTATTFLASANDKRKAANGSSYQVSFGRLGASCPAHCGTTSGDELAFASDATNLSPRDRNGVTDAYKKSMLVPSFRSTKHERPMRLSVKLVSVNPSGAAGNGPSSHPAINDSGRYVAFQTDATDILAGDSNGVTDVADADTDGNRGVLWVSRSAAVGEPGNGPSTDPSISRPGSPVFFASQASNLQPNPVSANGYWDKNGVQDVFFWNFVSGNTSLESRDSNNSVVGLPDRQDNGQQRVSGPTAAPFENPVASYYGNYMLFETSNPLIDLDVAGEALSPSLVANPRKAGDLARNDPAMHQVYLRYIGPR
jgi:hypothetical protein